MLTDSKILIVDDDLINIMLVSMALKDKYHILEAHNGIEALKILQEYKPDLILLDWNMPELNGIETLKYIKSRPDLNYIQVIMVTAKMEDRDSLFEAYNNGVVDFIRKPFDLGELEVRVRSFLQLAQFHKNEIDKKNNELVIQAIKLTENVTFLKKLLNQFEALIMPECQDQFEHLKKDVNVEVSENSWKNFEEHFIQVNPNFYSNLIKKHPDLSPGELKLCSLLRLNLNTKEISAITFTTPESIKVSRSRLRKKLNIEQESNLTGYLMQF